VGLPRVQTAPRLVPARHLRLKPASRAIASLLKRQVSTNSTHCAMFLKTIIPSRKATKKYVGE
jgi:hypothetical protein